MAHPQLISIIDQRARIETARSVCAISQRKAKPAPPLITATDKERVCGCVLIDKNDPSSAVKEEAAVFAYDMVRVSSTAAV